MYDIESVTAMSPVADASSSEKTFRRRMICAIVASSSLMYMAASGFSAPAGGLFDRSLSGKGEHEDHDAHDGHGHRSLFDRSLSGKGEHEDHDAHDGAHEGH